MRGVGGVVQQVVDACFPRFVMRMVVVVTFASFRVGCHAQYADGSQLGAPVGLFVVSDLLLRSIPASFSFALGIRCRFFVRFAGLNVVLCKYRERSFNRVPLRRVRKRDSSLYFRIKLEPDLLVVSSAKLCWALDYAQNARSGAVDVIKSRYTLIFRGDSAWPVGLCSLNRWWKSCAP